MMPAQCRAARAWLELSQESLAKAAGVSLSTVRDFEAGRRNPISNNLAAMRRELEARGVRFTFSANGEIDGIHYPSRIETT